MSNENALVPIEERTVIFYDDALTAVLVRTAGVDQVFVPARPLCEYLGIDWSAQRKRIVGDPAMAEEVRSVAVAVTEADGDRGGRNDE